MTRSILVSSVVLSAAALTACAEDLRTGRAEAEISESSATAVPTAGDRVIAVDPDRSRIQAIGAKLTGTHDIWFDDWQGSLTLKGDEVVGMEISIDMSGMRSDNDRLTTHLKSDDFFAVEQFPTATFTSTDLVVEAGDGGTTHVVSGPLTLHGITHGVRFPTTLKNGDPFEAHAEFVIDRQDFEISYPGKPDDLIQDSVVLTIDLVGSSASPLVVPAVPE